MISVVTGSNLRSAWLPLDWLHLQAIWLSNTTGSLYLIWMYSSWYRRASAFTPGKKSPQSISDKRGTQSHVLSCRSHGSPRARLPVSCLFSPLLSYQSFNTCFQPSSLCYLRSSLAAPHLSPSRRAFSDPAALGDPTLVPNAEDQLRNVTTKRYSDAREA